MKLCQKTDTTCLATDNVSTRGLARKLCSLLGSLSQFHWGSRIDFDLECLLRSGFDRFFKPHEDIYPCLLRRKMLNMCCDLFVPGFYV